MKQGIGFTMRLTEGDAVIAGSGYRPDSHSYPEYGHRDGGRYLSSHCSGLGMILKDRKEGGA